MLRRIIIGTAALSALISVGLASARADQTPPAQSGPPSAGSTGNGDWFRPTAATQAPSTGAPVASQDSLGDFPSGFSGQWIDAATRAAMTRAIYGQAQLDLGSAIRRADARFERSGDFQKALDAEQTAYDDYLASRQKALADLEQNPRYAELLRMQADLANRLAAGRQTHELTHDDILAMAELKLSYAHEARSMEITALAADTSVKDARDKMVATSRTVSDMRSDFDFNLPDSAEIATARRNMENARIAMLTASAYLNASATATAAAYDFAGYINGPTQPRVYNYSDPYGYGYGGTISPYWSRY
jgi:hypothetical protein